MKSVMFFNSKESRKVRTEKFINWQRENKTSRDIPSAEETRKVLYGK